MRMNIILIAYFFDGTYSFILNGFYIPLKLTRSILEITRNDWAYHDNLKNCFSIDRQTFYQLVFHGVHESMIY